MATLQGGSYGGNGTGHGTGTGSTGTGTGTGTGSGTGKGTGAGTGDHHHDHIGHDHDGGDDKGSWFGSGHDHDGWQDGQHHHGGDTGGDIHSGSSDSASASSTASTLPVGELIGHLINDALVFSGGGGQSVVIDFQQGQDLLHIAINVNGLPIQSAADVAARVTDINGHAVVDLGHGDTVTLHGVSATDVHHSPGSFFAVVH